MLGSRTKQVNSYGRRSSRIVNVSDRRDRESADSSSSEAALDTGNALLPRALRRENAIIISPAKHRPGPHRLKGSPCSPRGSPLATNRNIRPKATRDVIAKRAKSKLESNTHIRQPLTPLRSNGTSFSDQPSGLKGKSKASSVKPIRTSLKPHAPVIPVDIIVLDEEGNTLTQERRLSHTDILANQACNETDERKRNRRPSPPSPPPIIISDDSDLEVPSSKPVTKRRDRRTLAVVNSSDESQEGKKNIVHKKPVVPFSKPHVILEPLRVEMVVPSAPFQKCKVLKKSPSFPSPHGTGTAVVPSHFAPPFPIPKPRQLTPIRTSRSFFRRPPSTPSSLTEADLSLDFVQLDLSDTTQADDGTSAQPEYLVPLLNECAQTSPYEFSAFIETFPFDPVVQSSAQDEDARFRKIGEASYSEVFGIGDVVLKIIPIQLEGKAIPLESTEIPAPSDAEDVLKEIIVTREIGEICDKFVKLLKTYVVRGKYPSLLLDLWDEYNKRKGSESIRPDSFGLTQVYAIIILPNGGPDLESFPFKNVSKSGWHQACGIFWQVARALEQAEDLAQFEHRDLHWGQILVKSVPAKKSISKRSTSRVAMDDVRFGVKVTIIDLGLSRMSAADAQGTKIYWTPFDNEIFEGQGDYQYDIYRMMRDVIGGAWKSYHPFTNVLWLHYLATQLLREKRLKPPSGKRQTGGDTRVVSPTGYDEQECYDCLAGMEKLLGDCIASTRKSRRKTAAPTSGPRSAKDVVAYGLRREWVQWQS